MKSLFASLLAAVLVIAALAVHAATPVSVKAVFTADAGSPLPADEDKDKDKDKDKEEKKGG